MGDRNEQRFFPQHDTGPDRVAVCRRNARRIVGYREPEGWRAGRFGAGARDEYRRRIGARDVFEPRFEYGAGRQGHAFPISGRA